MSGCLVAPNSCGKKADTDPSADEQANMQQVSNFITRVWNYSWTPHDEQLADTDSTYVPPPVMDAITDFTDTNYIRHRRTRDGKRVIGQGRDEFVKCVHDVHRLCPDLRIVIIDQVAKDEYVTTLSVQTGTDIHVDRPNEQQEGVLNSPAPTGKRFRTHEAMLYRLNENRKIEEDWLLSNALDLLHQLQT